MTNDITYLVGILLALVICVYLVGSSMFVH